MRQRLAWMVAAASVLAACATGVDSADINAGDDGGGATVEGSPGVDAAHVTADGGGTQDTGSSTTADTGSSGDDASSTADSASTQEESSTQDSAMAQDTGTSVPETGTGQDTGTTGGGVCPNTAKYFVEAAQAVSSGNPTFCFSGVCSDPAECCYEQASPGNICVAQ